MESEPDLERRMQHKNQEFRLALHRGGTFEPDKLIAHLRFPSGEEREHYKLKVSETGTSLFAVADNGEVEISKATESGEKKSIYEFMSGQYRDMLNSAISQDEEYSMAKREYKQQLVEEEN